MGIEKIDKNFANQTVEYKDGVAYYAIPNKNFDLYGVYYCDKTKRFTRMPNDIAKKVSEGVEMLATWTAGEIALFDELV